MLHTINTILQIITISSMIIGSFMKSILNKEDNIITLISTTTFCVSLMILCVTMTIEEVI